MCTHMHLTSPHISLSSVSSASCRLGSHKKIVHCRTTLAPSDTSTPWDDEALLGLVCSQVFCMDC